MATQTASMQDCIQICQECQTKINDMLTSHCLAEGGAHVEQAHVKLMLDCLFKDVAIGRGILLRRIRVINVQRIARVGDYSHPNTCTTLAVA
ncbi:MAG: hypothetical protein ABI557_00965 [Aureliella sp.]